MRQICDFKQNVDNCDVTAGLHRVFYCNINLSIKWFVMFFIKFLVSIFFAEAKIPKPLLEEGNCESNQLACADETCLPNEYFCDGLLI